MSNAAWQIPLSGDLSPVSPETQNRNALMAMQVQQARQQMAGQNALKKILSDPNAIDSTTGLPTPNALKSMMAIDPQAGMAFQQGILKTKDQQLQLMDDQIKISGSLVSQVGEPAMIAYQDAIDKGLPEPDARRIGQATYTQGYEAVRQGGAVPKSIMDGVPSSFDPTRVRGNLMKYADIVKQHEDAQKQARADRKEDFQEEEAGKRDERADARMGQMAAALGARNESGGTLVTLKDKDGKDVPAFVEKDGSVKPVALPEGTSLAGKVGADKAGGAAFDPKMGELMAALAERGVSVPAGFRSKEQQSALYKGLLERNKDKTPDEIAESIAKGQLEFGAQKKEITTAAGKAGAVEVAQNELNEFVPLALKASAAVPRGSWVPLSRLFQMADESISDPALKDFKIRNQAVINAYDQLAARGGTDVKKREENHNLLTTADGPEAYKAALEAIQSEGEAAHRAAVRATRVSELSDPSKKPDASADDDGWTVTKVK